MSPTAEPPAVAPTPCEYQPWGNFAQVWALHKDALGCAIESGRSPQPVNEQPFQNGHMFWTGDFNELFVIYDNDGNFVWLNPPGNIENTPALGCPARGPGLREPVGGFGWMWQARLGGCSAKVGWALDNQHSFFNDRIQTFVRGRIFQDSDGRTRGMVFVLLNTLRFVQVRL